MDLIVLCALLLMSLATLLAAGFLGAVFVGFTVYGRIRPILVAVIVGGLIFIAAKQLPLPASPLTGLTLPLIGAATTAAATMRRSDWKTFGPLPSSQTSSTRLGVVGIAVGTVAAYLTSLTSLGKWVLNGLGQDVIGNMPGEVKEIRIAGAACGFFLGCFAAIVVCRLLVRRSTD